MQTRLSQLYFISIERDSKVIGSKSNNVLDRDELDEKPPRGLILHRTVFDTWVSLSK